MHLINKIFNNETIRTVWDKEEEKYYISVVDIVGVLSESENPRNYWKVLKHRLKKEGNESVTNCNQLKLKSSDDKYYNTDVVDIEGMFRIIESIPSKNAEPIKQWLAKLGKERIDDIFNPSLAAQRAIDIYRGITEGKEYAILTNEIYKEWSGMTAKEYKQYKGLRKESLRDNMDNIEIILADLSEETAKRLAQKHKPQGLEQNKEVARMGGHAAKVAREDIEKNLGEAVITKQNRLDYEYEETIKLDSPKEVKENKK